MSVLHPSPRKERNQKPIHRIIATIITSFNCHFLFWIWTRVTVLWLGGGGLGFSFSFFWLCVRLLWSDIDMNTVLDALVDLQQNGVGEIAFLGKVLYNGLIFFSNFNRSFFSNVCFFPFCPVSLSLAVDGLFCIHADCVASLFHLVNWKLLLNQTAVCLLYLRPSPQFSLISSIFNLVISNVIFYI